MNRISIDRGIDRTTRLVIKSAQTGEETMNTIHKFAIPIVDTFAVDMPLGAKVLAVQAQHGHPQIWAMVDTAQPLVPHRFYVIATGHEFSPDEMKMNYLGTFQTRLGELVFHLFEPMETV
jgi:hypothetical protein